MTHMKHPEVALGEVITRVKKTVDVVHEQLYKQVTVRLYNRGAGLRCEVLGAEIGSRQYLAKAGQFIVSGIDARHGAFAVVPPELDDAVVTNDFWVFDADGSTLDVEYLNFYAATKRFREQCGLASKGTTNRVRLKQAKFESIKMPLPPLKDQRATVQRLRAVLAKVEEAKRLRRAAEDTRRGLREALVLSGTERWLTAGECVTHIVKPVDVLREQTYRFAGVKSFGRGVFLSKTLRGDEFKYPKLHQVRVDQLVYPKLMAWEGAFGAVPAHLDGTWVSPEFQVFSAIEDVVLPEVLDTYFRSAHCLPAVRAASTGTNVRRRRLQPTNFLSLRVPVPSKDRQVALRRLYAAQRSRANVVLEQERLLEVLPKAILNSTFGSLSGA